jgi:hypothetical protein
MPSNLAVAYMLLKLWVCREITNLNIAIFRSEPREGISTINSFKDREKKGDIGMNLLKMERIRKYTQKETEIRGRERQAPVKNPNGYSD